MPNAPNLFVLDMAYEIDNTDGALPGLEPGSGGIAS